MRSGSNPKLAFKVVNFFKITSGSSFCISARTVCATCPGGTPVRRRKFTPSDRWGCLPERQIDQRFELPPGGVSLHDVRDDSHTVSQSAGFCDRCNEAACPGVVRRGQYLAAKLWFTMATGDVAVRSPSLKSRPDIAGASTLGSNPVRRAGTGQPLRPPAGSAFPLSQTSADFRNSREYCWPRTHLQSREWLSLWLRSGRHTPRVAARLGNLSEGKLSNPTRTCSGSPTPVLALTIVHETPNQDACAG